MSGELPEVEERAIDLARKMIDALQSDYLEASANLDREDTAFSRRTLALVFAAYVEAATHWMKQIALEWLGDTLSHDERTLLLERRTWLTGGGRVKSAHLTMNPKDSLRFALRVLTSPSPEFAERINGEATEQRWEVMQAAIAVRHRVIHPRSPRGVDVADDDVASIREAALWLNQCMRDMWRGLVEAYVDAEIRLLKVNAAAIEKLESSGAPARMTKTFREGREEAARHLRSLRAWIGSGFKDELLPPKLRAAESVRAAVHPPDGKD